MHAADTGATTYSDKFLHDICVNFILVGRDTLSVALAWFFWLLGKNPIIEANILKDTKDIIVAWRRSSSPPTPCVCLRLVPLGTVWFGKKNLYHVAIRNISD
ncbi:hypothetical protein GUJ93_ZPchr0010g8780 [Zizania palustris]|uniref:Cytochrome P450 n=1 Tax=Zizania palustris TaxID=103762 RepID=A0A8J5W8B1_ZIZPA|nr:hypothetical protein GUJ93_ZPchr0010g8780 [Zizania palustris]